MLRFKLQIEMTSEYALVDIVPTNSGTQNGPCFKMEMVIKSVELMSDIEMEPEWLRQLRVMQNNGELSRNDAFHKKLLFYLDQPSLTVLDTKMLKNLASRFDVHNSWNRIREENDMPSPKTARKKRVRKVFQNVDRSLRSKIKTCKKVYTNERITSSLSPFKRKMFLKYGLKSYPLSSKKQLLLSPKVRLMHISKRNLMICKALKASRQLFTGDEEDMSDSKQVSCSIILYVIQRV